MMDIEGLAHIGIRVTGFGSAIAFYRQLGFALVREDYQERVVVLRHPSGLELNLLDSVTTSHHTRNILMDEAVRYPGLTHIALRVRDLAAVQREVLERGIRITEGPVMFGDGSTSIFLRDPDRNVIELSEPQPAYPSQANIPHRVRGGRPG